jgi:hypothetical protein
MWRRSPDRIAAAGRANQRILMTDVLRCQHGLPIKLDCEQCQWERSVADDQASDEDWDEDSDD